MTEGKAYCNSLCQHYSTKHLTMLKQVAQTMQHGRMSPWRKRMILNSPKNRLRYSFSLIIQMFHLLMKNLVFRLQSENLMHHLILIPSSNFTSFLAIFTMLHQINTTLDMLLMFWGWTSFRTNWTKLHFGHFCKLAVSQKNSEFVMAAMQHCSKAYRDP